MACPTAADAVGVTRQTIIAIEKQAFALLEVAFKIAQVFNAVRAGVCLRIVLGSWPLVGSA